MIIICTFTFSFGIVLQAIMSPKVSSLSTKTIIGILNSVYWPLYGEMNILESIESTNCTDDDGLCQVSKASSYILLMIYMIIASVLLLNLLIAMFR